MRNLDAVEFVTLAWVDWFNNRRPLGTIGNIPSIELDQVCYQDKQGQAKVV